MHKYLDMRSIRKTKLETKGIFGGIFELHCSNPHESPVF